MGEGGLFDNNTYHDLKWPMRMIECVSHRLTVRILRVEHIIVVFLSWAFLLLFAELQKGLLVNLLLLISVELCILLRILTDSKYSSVI